MIILMVLGIVTQPENYWVFEEHRTKLIQLFGLFGLVVAVPMSFFIYKLNKNEKLFKKL